MITLKQLYYARAVARTLHFGRAAEQCHVSQSALSTALAELENQLALQLFERNNKKVMITPIGEQILQRAQTILLQVDDLQNLADAQKQPLSHPMTVGIIPTIAPYLLPTLLPRVQQQYPQAQLNIIEAESAQLLNQVRNGDIDTAILALPYRCDGLLTMEFWQEEFYWIRQRSGEQPSPRTISAEELAGQTLLLLNEGHCLKDHVLDVCRLNRDSHSQNVGATSLSTLVQMVLGGLGTTLVPAMALTSLIDHQQRLDAIPLSEPGPHRRLAFVLRPNFTRTNSIEVLRGLCRQALK